MSRYRSTLIEFKRRELIGQAHTDLTSLRASQSIWGKMGIWKCRATLQLRLQQIRQKKDQPDRPIPMHRRRLYHQWLAQRPLRRMLGSHPFKPKKFVVSLHPGCLAWASTADAMVPAGMLWLTASSTCVLDHMPANRYDPGKQSICTDGDVTSATKSCLDGPPSIPSTSSLTSSVVGAVGDAFHVDELEILTITGAATSTGERGTELRVQLRQTDCETSLYEWRKAIKEMIQHLKRQRRTALLFKVRKGKVGDEPVLIDNKSPSFDVKKWL